MFKGWFAVPEGQKITEKQLHRVLAASICSILLCMTCLAGTTWAWFVVELENTGNIIQIGNPEIHVVVQENPGENGTQSTESGEVGLASGDMLTAGDCALTLTHAGASDDLQQKSTLYVTMIIQYGTGSTITVYTMLDSGNGYETTVNLIAGSECQISWEVTWFAPVNAVALIGEEITVPETEPTEPTETTTEPTGESTEATTEATESTEETSEPTDPPETTQAPAETEPQPTDPTEVTTEPTETPTEPTETTAESTEATEATTEPENN